MRPVCSLSPWPSHAVLSLPGWTTVTEFLWSVMVKMVNGSRYYRVLESVSIASALCTALTIYPCQIQVHQHWESKLQLPTPRKKEWWPPTVDSLPQVVTCQHVIHTTLVGLEPATSRLLVRRATSSATDSPQFGLHQQRLSYVWIWTVVFMTWIDFYFQSLAVCVFHGFRLYGLLVFDSARNLIITAHFPVLVLDTLPSPALIKSIARHSTLHYSHFTPLVLSQLFIRSVCHTVCLSWWTHNRL